MKGAPKIDEATSAGGAALVIYLPVGYPSLDASVEAAKVAIDEGADIIEFGLPYSDPGMDGPIIAAATAQTLKSGFRVAELFGAVERVSGRGAAIEVMTYINPVFRYGYRRFAQDLASAGGAGLITPDLIPEEAGEWIEAADEFDLDKIFLVAQSSREERLHLISDQSRGFVYAASTMGVTGDRSQVDAGARDLVERTRAAGAQRVCLGLGISTGDQAREVAGYADGAIVGTAGIRAIQADPSLGAFRKLIGELKAGVAC